MKLFKQILVFFLASLLIPAFQVVIRPWLSAWLAQIGNFNGLLTNLWIACIDTALTLVCLAGAAVYFWLLRTKSKQREFNLACSVIGVVIAAVLAFSVSWVTGDKTLVGTDFYIMAAVAFYVLLAIRLFFYDLVYVGLKNRELDQGF